MSKRFTSGGLSVAVTGVSITTSAASASATIPNDSSGNIPNFIYVACTAAAHIRLDRTAATPTAVTTDFLLRPEAPQILEIARGIGKIAAIQNTAAGVVVVTPLENS